MTTDTRPLIVASDETVIDEVVRLAAAVGCTAERAPDLVAARVRWRTAPLVILDAEAAGENCSMPRRPGVLLVCKGVPASPVWKCAFGVGAERVLSLPGDEAELLAALADIVEGPSVPGGRVIGFLGGRGGAGASVLAAATGLAICDRGESGLLVDCDPLGGGLDILLGLERTEGLRWPELKIGAGRISMSALQGALPSLEHKGGRLSFISCDRAGPGPVAEAVTAVVESGVRAGRTVLCDLPRQLGETTAAVVDLADLIVLVVPAEIRACVAAKRIQESIGERARRVAVIARGPAPDGMAPARIAESVGAPLLAAMPAERGLALALEQGVFQPKPKSPLGQAARVILDSVDSSRFEATV